MSQSGRYAAAPLAQFCGEHFPNHFTEVAVDDDQQSLIVYRRPHPEFDRRVLAAFPDSAVRFVDSQFSQRELLELHGRVRAEHEEWLNRGILINSVGLSGDRVVVGVRPSDLDIARRALEQRYGRAISVWASDPVQPSPRIGPLKLPPQSS